MKKDFVWGSGLSPFFKPEDFLPVYPKLKNDETCEVLVIGGGLGGLLSAYGLTKEGKQVMLVTANTVADGAGRFSSGILSGDGGPDLTALKDRIGQENAVSWYRTCTAALERMKTTVTEIGSNCGFRIRDLFYYTESEKDLPALQEEYRLRRHIGLNCQWMNAEQCREAFSFDCAGGIRMENGGAECNTVQLCRNLADYLSLHGTTVCEGTRVDSITANGEGFLCRCGEHTITARQVVDARGGEVLSRRPQLGKQAAVYAIATEPVSTFRGWQNRCILKSYDRFSYLRTTPEDQIVLSGKLSLTRMPDGKIGILDLSGQNKITYRNLEETVKRMFIGIPRIRKKCGFCQGIVLTKNGLPLIGKDPQWKNLFYLYAFGENGIVSASVGADWIRRLATDPSARCPDYLSA